MMVKSFPDASFHEIHSRCGYLSDVMEAPATAVGLQVVPSWLVSPARCCCGGFWAATYLPLHAQSRLGLDGLSAN